MTNNLLRLIREPTSNKFQYVYTAVYTCHSALAFVCFGRAGENLNWKKYIAVCIDGVEAITGKTSGFILKKCIMTQMEWMHFFLQRYAFATKNNLKNVSSEAVKIIILKVENPYYENN